MEPDPSEMKALDDALGAFFESYVSMVQAVQRIKRIYEIRTLNPPKPEAPPMPHPTEITGSFCPRCHSIRLRNKGGGCMVCIDCGFDLGCNG